MTKRILGALSVSLLVVALISACGGSDNGLTCAAGETACGSSCVDINTNVANCGACGNACAASLVCAGGRCLNGGTVMDVAGVASPVYYVACGDGTNTNCTEAVAEASCTAIGRKLVSHASDGTSSVVSLGATNSCQWSISYFTNTSQSVAGKCLIGVSNAYWNGGCCTLSEWHGNIVTIPAALGEQFGYVESSNSGYQAGLSNVTGTNWGCTPLTNAPPSRGGCTTYYVACK